MVERRGRANDRRAMIVGCYTMDVYCDNGNAVPGMTGDGPGDSGHDFDDRGFAQSTGRTEGECKRALRARGWRFSRDGRVLCPRHA